MADAPLRDPQRPSARPRAQDPLFRWHKRKRNSIMNRQSSSVHGAIRGCSSTIRNLRKRPGCSAHGTQAVATSLSSDSAQGRQNGSTGPPGPHASVRRSPSRLRGYRKHNRLEVCVFGQPASHPKTKASAPSGKVRNLPEAAVAKAFGQEPPPADCCWHSDRDSTASRSNFPIRAPDNTLPAHGPRTSPDPRQPRPGLDPLGNTWSLSGSATNPTLP